jgi:hypothetical protein
MPLALTRKKVPSFDQQWALAIRAVSRKLPSHVAKRLAADEELALTIGSCMAETPLPQLRTMRWMREVLMCVAHWNVSKTRLYRN